MSDNSRKLSLSKKLSVASLLRSHWSLDAAAEQTVMEALNRLMEGRTTVLVAHHLSTIRRADVIFVIEDAEIIEHGSHEELRAANGPYAELYKIQTERLFDRLFPCRDSG